MIFGEGQKDVVSFTCLLLCLHCVFLSKISLIFKVVPVKQSTSLFLFSWIENVCKSSDCGSICALLSECKSAGWSLRVQLSLEPAGH